MPHEPRLQTDALAEPPEGELSFVLPFAPVSQQSSAEKRAEQCASVKAVLTRYGFVLTGDVHAEITWLVSERTRYESDASADVDNILKPLLDAMCGPDGILVDDCQLVSVSCGWIDTTTNEQELQVRLRYFGEQWFRKEGLVFVNLQRALCVPFLLVGPAESLRLVLDQMEQKLKRRDELERAGLPYDISSLFASAQRFFHRSKVTRFPIYTVEEVRHAIDAMRK